RTAETQRDRAEMLVYVGKLARAQREFQDGHGGLALQLLDEGQWDLRGWEFNHLWTRFNSRQTFVGPASFYGLAFSPDGRRIAGAGGGPSALRGPGAVTVWDAQTGQEVLSLRGHTGGVSGVAFSHDGRRIASAGADGVVTVWDADQGREMFVLRGHRNKVNG